MTKLKKRIPIIIKTMIRLKELNLARQTKDVVKRKNLSFEQEMILQLSNLKRLNKKNSQWSFWKRSNK
jgi:hypothetical protein